MEEDRHHAGRHLGQDAAEHEIKAEIGKAKTPVAEYHTKFAGGSYMWDEISALAWMDPSIITKQQELYVNIDIDHGASYGQTIFVEKDIEARAGPAARAAQDGGRGGSSRPCSGISIRPGSTRCTSIS